MTSVVTGSAGFIVGHLVRQSGESGRQTRCVAWARLPLTRQLQETSSMQQCAGGFIMTGWDYRDYRGSPRCRIGTDAVSGGKPPSKDL